MSESRASDGAGSDASSPVSRVALVDDQLDAGRIDRIGAIAADHRDVVDAFLLEAVDEPAQQRLAGDRQHDLRTIGGDGFEPAAAARRQHDRGARHARRATGTGVPRPNIRRRPAGGRFR